jgi:TolA-binding protein
MPKPFVKMMPVAVLFLLAPTCVLAQAQRDLESIDFAHGLFERKLYEMAKKEYKKFIDGYPSSEFLAEGYFGIAESAFYLKNYSESLEAYKTFIEKFPGHAKIVYAGIRWGECLIYLEKFEEAFNQLFAISPEGLDVDTRQMLFFMLAQASQGKKDFEKALEFYNKAVAEAPQSEYAVQSLFEMAEIYLIQNQWGEAVAYFKKVEETSSSSAVKGLSLYKQGEAQFVAKAYPQAAEIFKKLIETYPQEAFFQDACANLLSAHFNQSQFQEVIDVFKAQAKCLKEEGRFVGAYFLVTSAYAHLKRVDEAMDLLDKVAGFASLSADDKAHVTARKSSVLLEAKAFDKLLEMAKRMEEIQGSASDQTLYLKGESYTGLEQQDKALEAFNLLLQNHQGSFYAKEALYSLAHLQNVLGKSQESLDLFLKYYDQGENVDKRQEALYNAIILEGKLEAVDKAIEHAQLFLSTFPQEAEAVIHELGLLYQKKMDYPKAVEFFKKFIQDFPQSPDLEEAHFLLGYNHQMMGNLDEALAAYDKISLQTTNRDVLYSVLKNKAFIYLNKADDKNAAAVFEQTMRDFPENDLESQTYIWLSQYYLSQKNFHDVIKVLEQAEVKFKDSLPAGIYYFKAESYRQTQDYPSAIKNYDLVFGTSDQAQFGGLARLGKALCLVETNALDQARSELKAIVDQNLDDNALLMKARFQLAEVERLSGQLEEAIKYYMLVAVLYKDEEYCPQALMKAGTLWEQLGRKEEAFQAYVEVQKNYPHSAFFAQAVERIKALSEN